jgi:hypothetical protein
MKSILHWKSPFFGNTFQIFSGETIFGMLRERPWKQTSYGELNGKKFNFVTKGFFSQETLVFNADTAELLATISFNSWHTKASVVLPGGKIYTWKYDNFWNTRWSINDYQETFIKYKGSSGKGSIESDNPDDMLILTGLFITNYYWQISVAVIIAVLIPVFT